MILPMSAERRELEQLPRASLDTPSEHALLKWAGQKRPPADMCSRGKEVWPQVLDNTA